MAGDFRSLVRHLHQVQWDQGRDAGDRARGSADNRGVVRGGARESGHDGEELRRRVVGGGHVALVVRAPARRVSDRVRGLRESGRGIGDRGRAPRSSARVVGDHAGVLAVRAWGLGHHVLDRSHPGDVLGDHAVGSADLRREVWHHDSVAVEAPRVFLDHDDVVG